VPIAASSNYERPNRLKGREDGGIKWVELLDKFKSVQEKARRQLRQSLLKDDATAIGHFPDEKAPNLAEPTSVIVQGRFSGSSSTVNAPTPPQPAVSQSQKSKSGLGHLGRLSGAVGGRKTRR
jgi:vacuole morphology and inheritance protein 14